MAELISAPVRIPVPGGKHIDEYVGHVVNGESSLSIARMNAPAGWEEPAQRPQFDEFTLVLTGSLQVETDDGSIEVEAGQAVITRAGERVRYQTRSGATYVAVCLPAFAPEIAGREEVEE